MPAVDIDRACEVMHDAYEAAAAGAGWQTQAASRKPWVDVPEANKETMRAAVTALLAWLGAAETTVLAEQPGNDVHPADVVPKDQQPENHVDPADIVLKDQQPGNHVDPADVVAKDQQPDNHVRPADVVVRAVTR